MLDALDMALEQRLEVGRDYLLGVRTDEVDRQAVELYELRR